MYTKSCWKEYSEKLKFWKVFESTSAAPRETVYTKLYKFCGYLQINLRMEYFVCVTVETSKFTSEFVAAVTTYCMFEKACTNIASLCLIKMEMVLDNDEIKELKDACSTMVIRTATQKKRKKVLSQADANKDGQLDEEFEMLLKCNPMMLYPAWQMQNNMMNKPLEKNGGETEDTS